MYDYWREYDRSYEDQLSGELEDTAYFNQVSEDCEIDISCLEDEPF